MVPVVTQDGGVEELDKFPSALLVSWVIVGIVCFSLGLVCSSHCRSTAPPAGQNRWESLAKKAITFVNKRRRISVAFSALRGNTLRNSEGSRPNAARKALKARAHTPTPGRVLNEGPAVIRQRHGPHGR